MTLCGINVIYGHVLFSATRPRPLCSWRKTGTFRLKQPVKTEPPGISRESPALGWCVILSFAWTSHGKHLYLIYGKKSVVFFKGGTDRKCQKWWLLETLMWERPALLIGTVSISSQLWHNLCNWNHNIKFWSVLLSAYSCAWKKVEEFLWVCGLWFPAFLACEPYQSFRLRLFYLNTFEGLKDLNIIQLFISKAQRL